MLNLELNSEECLEKVRSVIGFSEYFFVLSNKQEKLVVGIICWKGNFNSNKYAKRKASQLNKECRLVNDRSLPCLKNATVLWYKPKTWPFPLELEKT